MFILHIRWFIKNNNEPCRYYRCATVKRRIVFEKKLYILLKHNVETPNDII